MPNGFMGKILWVDLSRKELREEPLDEKTGREFLGGYGLGARILFSRQKAGVDPLGPAAILGITTGVLTGTDALGGSRYIMVGKSPLTGGWGDANSGGNVGPYLKFAGYDAVFFTGISDRPVYLHINNGKAEIKDAGKIWGRDTFETQDIICEEHGKELEVACIGPAGEKVALIASVMNNKGRAAGRSGLGAVMGSKKLKAIAVQGNLKVPVADAPGLKEMRKRHTAELGGHVVGLRDNGTPTIFNMCCEMDDAPTKNWGGVAGIDMPTYTNLGAEPVVAKEEKKFGCYRCPIACGGLMKAGEGEYKYAAGSHKPEYETLAVFGPNCCNDNLESVIVANDICNRYGLDTISAGSCIGFTIECYENNIITINDTDGLEMNWGNHRAVVAMTEKLARREGFGDVIADGVKKAAERIGKGSEKYAMHVGGQEFGAHDPRGGWGFATGYGTDPTPGRHTQGGGMVPPGVDIPRIERSQRKGRGLHHRISTCFNHATNSMGMCNFIIGGFPHIDNLMESLKAITGWNDLTVEELIRTGERITNVRQAFNIREGLKTPFDFPDRMLGRPPKTVGPRAGITMTRAEIFNEYLREMDWDFDTGRPSKEKLIELGLDDILKELYK
ncbi:MAG TPA: aldehyde ferredoxin oxidoreductase family protein [Dehalococcoidia bacterium]|nr:aldehyde ferredoxin oxidoreductase family protein [Dehalococcoidia bacterium]